MGGVLVGCWGVGGWRGRFERRGRAGLREIRSLFGAGEGEGMYQIFWERQIRSQPI